MKRSEVVRYIANMFYEQNVEPEECDKLAEQLLHKLESFGMLPPRNDKEYNPYKHEDFWDYKEDLHEWDTEDD